MKKWQYEPAADLEQTLLERLREFSPRTGTCSSMGWRLPLVALIIRGLLRVYCRFEIVGEEHLRSNRSFVLVANHSSHLDTVCLLAGLPLRQTGIGRFQRRRRITFSRVCRAPGLPPWLSMPCHSPDRRMFGRCLGNLR